MIYLERLRDDPLLLDGFESNLANSIGKARIAGPMSRKTGIKRTSYTVRDACSSSD